jgi:hypothetical protein
MLIKKSGDRLFIELLNDEMDLTHPKSEMRDAGHISFGGFSRISALDQMIEIAHHVGREWAVAQPALGSWGKVNF